MIPTFHPFSCNLFYLCSSLLFDEIVSPRVFFLCLFHLESGFWEMCRRTCYASAQGTGQNRTEVDLWQLSPATQLSRQGVKASRPQPHLESCRRVTVRCSCATSGLCNARYALALLALQPIGTMTSPKVQLKREEGAGRAAFGLLPWYILHHLHHFISF